MSSYGILTRARKRKLKEIGALDIVVDDDKKINDKKAVMGNDNVDEWKEDDEEKQRQVSALDVLANTAAKSPKPVAVRTSSSSSSSSAPVQRRDNGECAEHRRFRADMQRAGLSVQHYRGRFHWSGPAVIVRNVQEAVRATSVPLQWDNMAFDWIVYPRAYNHH